LFEHADAGARLNHLGVEVMSTDEVAAHQARLAEQGLAPVDESGTCCFAQQEKVWVDGPDGAWEIYAVLADSDEFRESSAHVEAAAGGHRVDEDQLHLLVRTDHEDVAHGLVVSRRT